jgi:cytochrome P450
MTRSLADLPSPPGLPLIGHAREMLVDPLAFLTRTAATYGDLARFRVGPKALLIVSDPELIEAVLVKHRRAMHKDRITASLSTVLGQGLLTSEDELWAQNRKLIAPTFQPSHVHRFADTMVSCATGALAELPDGERDIYDDIAPLALEIVVRTVFGATMTEAERVATLVDEMMEAFDLQIHTWRRMLPDWVPTDARSPRAPPSTRSSTS